MAHGSSGDCQNNVLVFRKLPNCLEEDEIQDLLKHFGAKHVRYLGKHGQYKHSALARFASGETAQEVLQLTHQLEVLGTRLRVEYATKVEQTSADGGIKLPDQPKYSLEMAKAQQKPEELLPEEIPLPTSDLDKMSREWDVPIPADVAVKYSYPPPTETVLMNIVHCLACTPKFYTQVLHLMNKMNLPPPFHDITMEPPIQPDPVESEESELESEDEDNPSKAQKRTAKDFVAESFAKRIRMQIQDDLKQHAFKPSGPEYRDGSGIEDIFEVNQRLTNKPISILSKIQVTQQPPSTDTNQPADISQSDNQGEESGGNVRSGFGVFSHAERVLESLKRGETPPPISADEIEHHTEVRVADRSKSKFISEQELSANKLSDLEISGHPILGKTTRGQPSNKLYVKNLHKDTTENHLKYIFGRYVDWDNPEESSVFNIDRMTSGRMRGQAFVTFSGSDSATTCVNEVHGYVLNRRPISVCFSKPSAE